MSGWLWRCCLVVGRIPLNIRITIAGVNETFTPQSLTFILLVFYDSADHSPLAQY